MYNFDWLNSVNSLFSLMCFYLNKKWLTDINLKISHHRRRCRYKFFLNLQPNTIYFTRFLPSTFWTLCLLDKIFLYVYFNVPTNHTTSVWLCSCTGLLIMMKLLLNDKNHYYSRRYPTSSNDFVNNYIYYDFPDYIFYTWYGRDCYYTIIMSKNITMYVS